MRMLIGKTDLQKLKETSFRTPGVIGRSQHGIELAVIDTALAYWDKEIHLSHVGCDNCDSFFSKVYGFEKCPNCGTKLRTSRIHH